ncbi:sulfotransferase family 2 domain-containing protein [Paraburkholderia sp. RL17-337-BIB-A]|uniref:sulfotransferase family 2 domain-containing protein n=1 Tax=Paraburkholderia sp. RL17-337-BIB-A TaxID=3031636 RepID=UPI0038B86848
MKVMPAVFIHIPKTAGTSLGAALSKHYNAIVTHYPPDGIKYGHHPDDVDCVIGHFAYGFNRHILGGRESFEFTFLREPRKRFVSQLHYDLRFFSDLSSTDAPALPEALNADSVREFINANELLYFDNCLVRYLSGRWNYVPLGALTERDLDLAKENLMRLDFIGDVDNYESDARRLGDLLGFEIETLKENRGDYAEGDAFPSEAIPEQFVEMDAELYRFYRKFVRI